MNISLQSAVKTVAEEIMVERRVPGMVVAVVEEDSSPAYLTLGVDGAGRALSADMLFPVASISKLATALAVLRLVDAGKVQLDDLLARHLPDAAAADEQLTLRMLFCHTAGLPEDLAPGAAPYVHGLDWPALARACLATRPVLPPCQEVNYSSVGSGLLAVLVERLTGHTFAQALSEWVLEPLGIEGYLGAEPPRRPAVIVGNYGEHAGTELEPYNSSFWRSLALPWGGLITNAAGALGLVCAFAGVPAGFLSAGLRAEATRDQTSGLGGRLDGLAEWPRCPWGLGVELHGDKSSHMAPPQASAQSFGHGGASGCLAWHDPAAGVSWAILGTLTVERWWRRWADIGAAILAAAG